MLEFYLAYADYEDMMEFTENMLNGLVRSLNDNADVRWQKHTLSFEKPFKRERYVDVMSERLGIDILKEKDPKTYVKIFEKEELEIPHVQTYEKLVDELYKELVRSGIVQPTFLYDYPVELVPLAKQNLTDPRVAESFQLLAGGAELVKAYTELNDPVEQRARFEKQQADRDAGDEEAPELDEAYLRAMEYGMPPVAGFGMGIDRLVMMLADTPHLRDTILFPLLKPHN
jgi:lysyl-tRNA synthetase class 2